MFSSYIVALTVYFPLLVLCSPTVSSQHHLPPPLSKHTLSLVRKQARNISHHRFVCSPSTPSSPSSRIYPHYDSELMNDAQLGTRYACRGTDRVRVAPPLGVRSSVHPSTRTPQKRRGERCTLHCQEVRLFFPSKPFPLWEAVMCYADVAAPQLNAESLRKNPPIIFHSSKVVQSGILPVSFCSFSFLFSFSTRCLINASLRAKVLASLSCCATGRCPPMRLALSQPLRLTK